MQRVVKSPTRLIALPTGRFRHLTHGSNKAPTTMLAYSASCKNIEARWFERLQKESTALLKILDEDKDRWAKLLEEEETRKLNEFEGIVKSLNKQRTMLLDYFDEWQQRHDKDAEKLVLENCDLLYAALGERSERMKLEKRYNNALST
ncbi:hypothetical protein B9Z19DRAFT_86851 [Tuber borchii]|uniref:Uncharacterized protein n=1 Tax=Tuber borchii TaxID=42251 RepID=A0A2T6ZSB5_TUBBO|nr:hypothetical protein B9Z19DRAFT_86851 [Tuber borchii]